MKFGIWTFTPMFIVATASVVVFLAALWTAPQVGGAVRPVATGFVVSLLVSVPIHELAHAVMVRHRGHDVDQIDVGLYSGVVWSAGSTEASVGDVLLVSAAGPACNAVVAVAGLVAILLTRGADSVLAGVASAMALASVLDLIPSASRHRGPDGHKEFRMSDGAIIRHAWRQRHG